MNEKIYILVFLLIVYFLLNEKQPSKKILSNTNNEKFEGVNNMGGKIKKMNKNIKKNINPQCIAGIFKCCINSGNNSNLELVRTQTICNCNIKDMSTIESMNLEELRKKNESCNKLIKNMSEVSSNMNNKMLNVYTDNPMYRGNKASKLLTFRNLKKSDLLNVYGKPIKEYDTIDTSTIFKIKKNSGIIISSPFYPSSIIFNKISDLNLENIKKKWTNITFADLVYDKKETKKYEYDYLKNNKINIKIYKDIKEYKNQIILYNIELNEDIKNNVKELKKNNIIEFVNELDNGKKIIAINNKETILNKQIFIYNAKLFVINNNNMCSLTGQKQTYLQKLLKQYFRFNAILSFSDIRLFFFIYLARKIYDNRNMRAEDINYNIENLLKNNIFITFIREFLEDRKDVIGNKLFDFKF